MQPAVKPQVACEVRSEQAGGVPTQPSNHEQPLWVPQSDLVIQLAHVEAVPRQRLTDQLQPPTPRHTEELVIEAHEAATPTQAEPW